MGVGLAVGTAVGVEVGAGAGLGFGVRAGVGSTTGPGPPMHSQPLTSMNVQGGWQTGTPIGRLTGAELTGAEEVASEMAMAVLSASIPGMMSTREIVPRQRADPGAPRRRGAPRERDRGSQRG